MTGLRWLCLLLALAAPRVVSAAEYLADPATYSVLVQGLRAGDVLLLVPGVYVQGLRVIGLTGTATEPIRIEAANPAQRPIFLAQPGRNTVSIVNSQHVQIRGLQLEGRNLPVDAVKAEGHARFAHHITLENLRISGHAFSQQNVGISTKCPASGWVVRGNEIVGVGTGMYFGNSDGSAAFWNGLIEGNVVRDTIGYNVQIKHQSYRPGLEGEDGPTVTTIRNNVFEKTRAGALGEAARPNLLVGHQPRDGRGADDRFLIYGNLFLRNPTEVLFQGEGNISLYNNVFVNPEGSAIHVRPHNGIPQDVYILLNTVVARDAGIRLDGANPLRRQRVEGNAVFAGTPLGDPSWGNNVVGSFLSATAYLQDPLRADEPDPAPTARLVKESARLNWASPALAEVAVDRNGKARSRKVAGAHVEGATSTREGSASGN